ncbi:MAG: 3-hydroxyacyl-CoA dehydrogenase [Robiginitomaculum sp.]|nr:MAG: 3-hydroxyacyl-CoA dehydrogenase [Robiginitomaculum sp.]
MKHFKIETDKDGIALVTFDSPDVTMNLLSRDALTEIGEWTDMIVNDDAIKGVVVTGKPNAFCAGADLSGLGEIFGEAQKLPEDERKALLFEEFSGLHKVFRKLETCGKPVAAAINGLALGGGFEITLACHYRIASNDNPKIKLGLPEAMVGVLPGGGGTQRMPRLIGAMNAFDLMLQGKMIKVDKALALGLLHDACPADELIGKAKAWVKANPDAKQPWDQENFKIPGGGPYHPAGYQTFAAASPMLRKNTMGNYPSQRYILACVYEGLQVDFDAGIRIETRYFTRLMMRPESRNMIRSIFLSKQDLDKGGARPAGQEKGKITKIAVIGAGFMGAGIAYVSAMAGVKVALIDVDQAGADKGKAFAEKELSKRVSRKRMDQEKADRILERITATTDYGVMKDVDLVVEAVFESRELKAKITKMAEEILPENAIFGSNTSTLPITGLAEASKRPENYIGIHFFSPVHKMMLVELIVGEKTSDYAISRALDFVTRIRKTPIVVSDTRGFYANRCVMRYIEQGMGLLSEGVKPALIENASRMAGMPVGPLSLQDEVAIDLGYKILKQTETDLGPEAVKGPTAPIIRSMIENHDRKGRKNSKGFYDYNGKEKRLWPGLSEFAPKSGLQDPQPSPSYIKDRILIAIALEAARCMEEGIVTDPREADVGSILGWGFAPYTGGVLSYIDTMGAAAFVARADELSKDMDSSYDVPDLLREMAKNGETFYGRFGKSKAA